MEQQRASLLEMNELAQQMSEEGLSSQRAVAIGKTFASRAAQLCAEVNDFQGTRSAPNQALTTLMSIKNEIDVCLRNLAAHPNPFQSKLPKLMYGFNYIFWQWANKAGVPIESEVYINPEMASVS